MRVLFVTNIPTPYRIRFFNELSKHVELTVLYEAETAKNIVFSFKNVRNEGFQEIFLKKGVIREKIPNLRIISPILRRDYDYLILTNYAYFTELVAYITARIFRIPYIIEEDGNRIKTKELIILSWLKRWIIRGASLYLSPSKQTDEFFKHYSANQNKIIRYPFTSIDKAYLIKASEYQYQKKDVVSFLYVGRVIPLKGVDNLIHAFNAAILKNPSIQLTIIGNSPDENYLNQLKNYALSQVQFLPFMETSELRKYYLESDVFVFPTRYDPWGLVINEAISLGLPVISSNKSISASELIQNGVNGFLYDSENVADLEKHMLLLAADEKLRKKMSKFNIELAKSHTIESMVKVHLNAFKRLNYHE